MHLPRFLTPAAQVELHNLRQRIRALCDIMKAHAPTRASMQLTLGVLTRTAGDADLVAKMLSEATACLSKVRSHAYTLQLLRAASGASECERGGHASALHGHHPRYAGPHWGAVCP